MRRVSVIIMILTLVSVTNGCNPAKRQLPEVPQVASYAKKVEQPENKLLLGLPKLEMPKDNPMTQEKIDLGNRLFHDIRFSKTGKVSCATCHDKAKFFTDSPLRVSKGIDDKEGTRNAPSVINAAFGKTQFWDGRSPTLEDQSLHPFVNPVEMALNDHEPIIKIIKDDKGYLDAFKKSFNVSRDEINIDLVTKAIAAFERTLIAGNSRFDRWYYNDEKTLNNNELKGFDVFLNKGRCVSCHVVEQTTALFTDHLFHNIGVGINRVPQDKVNELAVEFLKANYNRDQVDKKVLSDPLTSELGRFVVTKDIPDLGAFKTSPLRNIEHTAPYMHDGSLKTLEEVVQHYNRGGASSDEEKITPFLSGGIKPLGLTDQEIKDLVAFLKSLNTPELDEQGSEDVQ